jgi:hypothetical protein
VLDHVGHFVPDLEAAGELLGKLGFFSTPVSHHQANGQPAGTANRCVMMREGYLEILAPTLDTPNAARVRSWMNRYPGVHLVSWGTPAAAEDHTRLASHDFSPDALVELRRKTAEGEVGFRVVYVPPEKMPECRAQYCQHLTPDITWHDFAARHTNGVIGLSAAYIVADDPKATAARWAEFSGLLPVSKKDEIVLTASRGTIHIASRDALSTFMDNVPPAPGVAAIGLRFSTPSKFSLLCEKNGLKVRKTKRGRCVSLPPALGGNWLF